MTARRHSEGGQAPKGFSKPCRSSLPSHEAQHSKVDTRPAAASLKLVRGMNSEARGGGGAASSKELEALRAENEGLKKANAKQAYRIQHLVVNLREKLEGEQKQ